MSTEVKKKESPMEAAKKGLAIGAKVGLLGIVASVLFVYFQTPSVLPKCDSPEAISLATQHLNEHKLVKYLRTNVSSLENPVTVAETPEMYGCNATMIMGIGKEYPIAYRIKWEDKDDGTYSVYAALNK